MYGEPFGAIVRYVPISVICVSEKNFTKNLRSERQSIIIELINF